MCVMIVAMMSEHFVLVTEHRSCTEESDIDDDDYPDNVCSIDFAVGQQSAVTPAFMNRLA